MSSMVKPEEAARKEKQRRAPHKKRNMRLVGESEEVEASEQRVSGKEEEEQESETEGGERRIEKRGIMEVRD